MGRGLHFSPEEAEAMRRGRGDIHAGRWPSTNPVAPPARKYHNEPCEVDGQRFDSRWEAECWQRLQLRFRAGEIHGLDRQVRVPLHTNGQLVGYYVSDFYWEDEFGRHFADAKGGQATQTQLFRWKAKHLEAEYGVKVEIMERRA